jgi:hypothetical protein
MPVCIQTYRAQIGIFLAVCSNNITNFEVYFWGFIFPNIIFLHIIMPQLILSSGNVEQNPGPVDETKVELTICHCNVRSLLAQQNVQNNQITIDNIPPKLIELELLALRLNADILVISETWLDATINSNEIDLEPFSIPFRRDRNRHGGGVAAYISTNIGATRLQNIEPAQSEILCLEVQLPGTPIKHLLLLACYRPPNKDMLDFLSDLDHCLEETQNKQYYEKSYHRRL